MSLLPKAAAIALAAVAFAPALAHAQTQVPNTLSVVWQPSQPTTHDDVAFTAKTTAPEITWDWVGDRHPDAPSPQQTLRRATVAVCRVMVKATDPAVGGLKQEVESIRV